MITTVRLNSKYQIVIPQAARQALSLSPGDELLILCKPDRIVIMPKPAKFSRQTAGLHREVWTGAETYLQGEREDG